MPLQIADRVPLAPFTTLELGGLAEHLVQADDRNTLVEALAWARERALAVTVLGGGSNVVVSDAGVPGLVIVVGTKGIALEHRDDRVVATVEAGEEWDRFVAHCVDERLAGLECLSGIPGRVGASPIQNIGAYGQEVGDRIVGVEVFDTNTRQTTWLDAERCEFGYRASRFKRESGRFVVLAVRFALEPNGRASIRYVELAQALGHEADPSLASVRDAVRRLRRAKSMLIEPGDENRRSVGSFFLNPIVSTAELEAVCARARSLGIRVDSTTPPRYPQADGSLKLSAAWLIEHSGTGKGERAGGVGVSSRHTLALVHHGGAHTQELVKLAQTVRERVFQCFGVRLVPEPVMLGFDVRPLS